MSPAPTHQRSPLSEGVAILIGAVLSAVAILVSQAISASHEDKRFKVQRESEDRRSQREATLSEARETREILRRSLTDFIRSRADLVTLAADTRSAATSVPSDASSYDSYQQESQKLAAAWLTYNSARSSLLYSLPLKLAGQNDCAKDSEILRQYIAAPLDATDDLEAQLEASESACVGEAKKSVGIK